jgi:hypothetical protein
VLHGQFMRLSLPAGVVGWLPLAWCCPGQRADKVRHPGLLCRWLARSRFQAFARRGHSLMSTALDQLQEQRFSLLERASCDPALTDFDFRVLYRLLDRVCRVPGERFGKVWVSARTIAAEIGANIRSVRRSLERLRDGGYVHCRENERGGGRTPDGRAITTIYRMGVEAETSFIGGQSDGPTVTAGSSVTVESPLTVTLESANSDRTVRPSVTVESPKPYKKNPEKNPGRIDAHASSSNAPLHDLLPSLDEHPLTPPRRVGKAAKSPDSDDHVFEEFWSACPKRQGKCEARKAYAAAIKRNASAGQLLNAIRRYAEHVRTAGTDDHWIKTPGPWLNAERYLDEYPADPSSSGQIRSPSTSSPRQSPGIYRPGPTGRREAPSMMQAIMDAAARQQEPIE